MPEDKILRENLIVALEIAIDIMRKDRDPNGLETAQVAGWKSNLEALRAGRTLEIR